jgi:hypothetical protein
MQAIRQVVLSEFDVALLGHTTDKRENDKEQN